MLALCVRMCVYLRILGVCCGQSVYVRVYAHVVKQRITGTMYAHMVKQPVFINFMHACMCVHTHNGTLIVEFSLLLYCQRGIGGNTHIQPWCLHAFICIHKHERTRILQFRRSSSVNGTSKAIQTAYVYACVRTHVNAHGYIMRKLQFSNYFIFPSLDECRRRYTPPMCMQDFIQK